MTENEAEGAQTAVTVASAIGYIKDSLHRIYPAGEVNYIIRIIFEKLMGYNRTDMIVRANHAVEPLTMDSIRKIVHRLLDMEPIQYIFGEARFYGNEFYVNRSTLIPRPETEQLIEIIDRDNKEPDLEILDIGTGSGCIAITLARILRFPKVTALDISADALDVVRRNAEKFKVKIAIVQADILSYVLPQKRYNIIVSNPPYICDKERGSMSANVLDYEPATALFVPDNDPLLFYRRISTLALKALKPGGKLYFEINPLYAKDITAMLGAMGFDNISTADDFNGMSRFISAHLP